MFRRHFRFHQSALFIAVTALTAVVLSASCSSTAPTREREYAFKAYIRGTSSRENLSKEKIDKHPSYEAHFTLEKDEECIKITVVGRDIYAIGAFVDPSIRIHFVLEKAVDVSRFNQRTGRIVYTEIARNYDANWKSERDAIVRSIADDPIKKLTPDAYRIRLVAFESKEFSFSIAIATNEARAVTAPQAEREPR